MHTPPTHTHAAGSFPQPGSPPDDEKTVTPAGRFVEDAYVPVLGDVTRGLGGAIHPARRPEASAPTLLLRRAGRRMPALRALGTQSRSGRPAPSASTLGSRGPGLEAADQTTGPAGSTLPPGRG